MIRAATVLALALAAARPAGAQGEIKDGKYSNPEHEVTLALPDKEWGEASAGTGEQLVTLKSRDQMVVVLLAFEELDYSLADYAAAWEKVHGSKVGLKKRSDAGLKKPGDWLRREYDGQSDGTDIRFVLVLHKRGKRIYRLILTAAAQAWEKHESRLESLVQALEFGGKGPLKATVRWLSPEEYEKLPQAAATWAREAEASSKLGQSGDPKFALGAPDVFPRPHGSKNLWMAGSSSTEQEWLKVRFEPTKTREVRIFAITKHLGIAEVRARTPGGDEIVLLRRAVNKDEVGKAKDPKVLSIEIDPGLEIAELTVVIRPKDAGFYQTYIDAVGLVPAKP
jgi:hypothetical protein